VIPELALNGEVFKTGSTLRIGNEIDMSYQVLSPIATYAPYRYSVIAGSYLNIPVIGQTVSPTLLQKSQTNIELAKATLNSGDLAEINALNREAVLGDMFYTGSLGYFSQYDGLSHFSALQNSGAHKMDISYGSYGYEPEPNTFFGISRGINAGGAALNIRIGRSVQSFDGENEKRKNLRFQTGAISSALEHYVPEQMFNEPDNFIDGISAVKALQIAAEQGQRIYEINQNNVTNALSNLALDSSIETEIRNAVTQGRIAIAHTRNVSVPGWSGAGYLILDPEIMDGSYKIAGGGNGGEYEKDDVWSKTLNYFSQYGIKLNLSEVTALFLFGSIPKSWVGATALLGSKNPLTSVLRGLLGSPLGKQIIFRALFIPAATLTGIFIGFYNITIILSGFFYALF